MLYIETLHYHIVRWNHIISLKMKDKLFLEITHQIDGLVQDCSNSIACSLARSHRNGGCRKIECSIGMYTCKSGDTCYFIWCWLVAGDNVILLKQYVIWYSNIQERYVSTIIRETCIEYCTKSTGVAWHKQSCKPVELKFDCVDCESVQCVVHGHSPQSQPSFRIWRQSYNIVSKLDSAKKYWPLSE